MVWILSIYSFARVTTVWQKYRFWWEGGWRGSKKSTDRGSFQSKLFVGLVLKVQFCQFIYFQNIKQKRTFACNIDFLQSDTYPQVPHVMIVSFSVRLHVQPKSSRRQVFPKKIINVRIFFWKYHHAIQKRWWIQKIISDIKSWAITAIMLLAFHPPLINSPWREMPKSTLSKFSSVFWYHALLQHAIVQTNVKACLLA